MSTRTRIVGLALGRLAIGAALVASPRLLGEGWIGEDARRPAGSLLLRAVGARDAALALGTLAALRSGGALKPWLIGASLADATDLLATLGAGKGLPMQARASIVPLAGGALVTQLAIARRAES